MRLIKWLIKKYLADVTANFRGLVSDLLRYRVEPTWATEVATGSEFQLNFYGFLVVALSLIVAVLWARYLGVNPDRVDLLLGVMRVPVLVVVHGVLISVLLWIGAQLIKTPKTFTYCTKVMFRVVAVMPLLVPLSFNYWGDVGLLIILGLFLVRAARRSFVISRRNAFLFFGLSYVVFAIVQIQALEVRKMKIESKQSGLPALFQQ
jgi:hypothetical protein